MTNVVTNAGRNWCFGITTMRAEAMCIIHAPSAATRSPARRASGERARTSVGRLLGSTRFGYVLDANDP